MKLEEATELAKQGIKVTHEYFTDDEYMTIQGDLIVFENNSTMLFVDYVKNKDYLKDGWSKYIELGVPFDENLYK